MLKTKLPRFIVKHPSINFTGDEAYEIFDRETKGVIATVYRDGGESLPVKLGRAKKQAEAMARALNRLGLGA